jgi:hypothetical protein
MAPLQELALEDVMLEARKRYNPPVITSKNFRALLHSCGIRDDIEIIKATQAVFNMGTIVTFTSQSVRSLVVLNPQWLYESIISILSKKEEAVGSVSCTTFLEDLDKISVSASSLQYSILTSYPIEFCSQIIAIMEHGRVCFALPQEDVYDPNNPEHFNSPQRRTVFFSLLPNARPPWFKFEEPPKSSGKLIKKYEFSELPQDVMCGIVGSMLHMHFAETKTTPTLFWKKGASISDSKGNVALLEVTAPKTLTITVMGPKFPESLMRSISRMLDLFLDNFYSHVSNVTIL